MLPEYRQHVVEGTQDKFLAIACKRYFEQFPEQDVPTPAFERTRTASGKWSKKRPEGVEKPRREVDDRIRTVLKAWLAHQRR